MIIIKINTNLDHVIPDIKQFYDQQQVNENTDTISIEVTQDDNL